jgi:hypothetical protein
MPRRGFLNITGYAFGSLGQPFHDVIIKHNSLVQWLIKYKCISHATIMFKAKTGDEDVIHLSSSFVAKIALSIMRQ